MPPVNPLVMNQQGAINPVPQNKYALNNLTSEWRQFTSKNGWTEDMAFGPGITRAAFIIDVPWANLETAIMNICGYSANPGGGKIKRYVPIQHPNLYWMWAKNITKVQAGTPTGVNTSNVDQAKYTAYNFARLTIEFWQPTYAIVEDGGIANEWERYVDWAIEPAGEFLSRPQGVFKWTAGGPQNGMTFNGQKNLYLPKKRIKAVWRQIPESGLFPNLKRQVGDFTSANLDAMVGKVNNASWAGLATGTVLMEAWGCEPEIVPVNPSNLSIDTGWHISRLWNVVLSFLHFDPPPGGANRGHNTFPQNDNLWWPVIAVGGANLPYKTGDMSSVWKMN